MNTNIELGMRVRYLREQKKMTLEDLAFESNMNKNYLSDLERGNRNPTVKILTRIAEALEVTLEELFKGIRTYWGPFLFIYFI